MATATTIRMDESLKDAVTRRLDALGMTFNTFVVMASKQLVAQNRLPFSTTVPRSWEPTEETRRAMVAAEAKSLGLIPDDSPAFSSVDDLMVYLDEEA